MTAWRHDEQDADHDGGHEPRAARHGLAHRLRNYLITGIVVTAPLVLTVFLVWSVVSWFDAAIAAVLPPRYNPNTYLPFGIPGIGLVLALTALTAIGWFAAGVFGRTLMRIGELIVHRMPVVSSIYATFKQIFETVLANSSQSFREVVLVEWPRRGSWVMAFVTGRTRWRVEARPMPGMVNLFMPSTPNPTTGFLLMVPEEDVVRLDLSVDEGIKMIVSGGIVNHELKERALRRSARGEQPERVAAPEQVQEQPERPPALSG
jgi:uncharacterized membrane protein